MDHEVGLDESQIDEVAAWLRYATGEETWDGGDGVGVLMDQTQAADGVVQESTGACVHARRLHELVPDDALAIAVYQTPWLTLETFRADRASRPGDDRVAGVLRDHAGPSV